MGRSVVFRGTTKLVRTLLYIPITEYNRQSFKLHLRGGKKV